MSGDLVKADEPKEQRMGGASPCPGSLYSKSVFPREEKDLQRLRPTFL